MEQSKCGEVYRDVDGNFSYVCNCCSFDFLTATDFEQHIIHVPILKDERISNEDSPEQNYSIQIEPVLVRGAVGNNDDDDEIEDEDEVAMSDFEGDGGIVVVGDGIYDDDDDEMDEEMEFKEPEFIIESESISHEDILINISDESMFKCDCCDKTYACRGLKQQHLLNFMDESKTCKLCPAYYEKEAEFNAHQKVHNLADTFVCPHCSEVFASVNKLKRHLTSSKTEMGLPAAKRTRKSTAAAPAASKRTQESDVDDAYAETATTNADDDDNFEVEGGDKKRQKFVCKICRKEYSYMHYLKKHLKRHSDNTLNHACEICGHEFKLRQNLTAHMRTHTGEKPFKCRLCGKAFNQPYYMTIHMRIHQKEKPYQCTLCGVSFVTSSHLGRHMKSHNNIKPHQCKQCDRAFILPGHLQDHIRSQHTLERPFRCDVCGNTFSRRKLLRQHKQLHGEKRFKCKYCDQVFSQSAGRRGHEIRVHNANSKTTPINSI